MKKLLWIVFSALVALAAVLVIRAALFVPQAVTAETPVQVAADPQAAAARLGRAIAFRTISYAETGKIDTAAFEALHAWLAETYPQVHRRLVLANLWLLDRLLIRQMSGEAEGSAMIRTSTAATMFHAGIKDNVLPVHARAVVNFRLLPGDTLETVTERVRGIIDDPRVQITPATEFAVEPSPISDPGSDAFRTLVRAVRRSLPGTRLVVAPYLVLAATDSRYYAGRSKAVFRFFPMRLARGDTARMHGTDERLAIEDLAAGVRFYSALLRSLDAL